MKKVVLDTNVILDDPEILENEEYEIYIPLVVLQEIDGLKNKLNVGYNARTAIRKIYQLVKQNKIHLVETPIEQKNDDLILDVAKNLNTPLISNDITILIKAKQNNIKTILNKDTKIHDKDFKGYYDVELDYDYFFKTFYTLNEFQHCEVEEYLKDKFEVPVNSYLRIFPEGTKDYCQITRKTKNKYYKIDMSKKFLKGLAIKGILEFDDEIFIALDAIRNDSLMTVIEGKIGSGKTLTSILGSLIMTIGNRKNKKFNQIAITRPPIPVDRALEIGFLPGNLEEKLLPWMEGVSNSLNYLFQDKEKTSQVFNDIFKIISLETIQGMSLHETILIVDEAQLLNENMMKQVMSRVADDSKLIFLLDPNQNYDTFKGKEGYKKLLPYCKNNNLISYIKLEKIRRSPLTELSIKIFG